MDKPAGTSTVFVEDLLGRIDRGIESHLEWTQRLLRCSVLRESPGDDVLRADAHRLCRLGGWLERDSALLDGFEAGIAERLLTTHRKMHDAVRAVCQTVLAARPSDPADLKSFEENQTRLVGLLTALREVVSDRAIRRDPLTGLPLRHGLGQTFMQRRSDAARFKLVLHVVMIDVDHFKTVNDTYGHPVGDQALRHAASILQDSLRRSDVLVRYGGEEFLAMLLNTGARGALATAQRLLEAFRSTPMREGGLELPIRISLGLAAVGPAETLESAVERADRALLKAKQDGRDRAVMAGDPPAGA